MRILYIFVMLFFISCGGGSDSKLSTIVDVKRLDTRANLSFFCWDGVKNYEKAVSLLDGYDDIEIYLNPIEDGSRDNFTSNVEYLQQHNSKVWFLLSSSEDENNPSLDYIQSQIDIIDEYNTNHTKKIAGMMLDVEPWNGIDEQNSSENIDMWSRYLTLLKDTKAMLESSNLELGAVIPFWLDNITEAFVNDRAINYDVIDAVDEVVIMDYTTHLDRFYEYAKSSLVYADKFTDKRVKIAIETTDINNDEVSFFNDIEKIREFLYTVIKHDSFAGYSIHTLDSFAEHNLSIKLEQ
ncbi:MAG: hypothetical protein GXO30_01830 [Epsilonproteobacteria bacterium]|nr:hypothetical protein [Campylobacterota bacterium]